jgi:predicted dehydrogenase
MAIRMGIIGCGRWMSRGHIGLLMASPDVGIVGLADPSDESIATLCATHPGLDDIPAFADHRAMLDAVKPDAVVIATPHTLHLEHAVDAFAAGCHVMLEKPMVTSVAEARTLLAKRDEAGRELLVAYQRHYTPAYRYVAAAIAGGDIGAVEYVAGLQTLHWTELTEGRWRQDYALSGGGQMIDAGSHLFDSIMFAIDRDVAAVMAYQSGLTPGVDVNSAIALRFAGGALATIALVGMAPAGWWEDISFYGSDGAILIRTPGFGDWADATVTHRHKTKGDIAVELPAASTPDGNFIDLILGRDENRSPGEAGLRVIQVSEAAARSAESGREERPD